MERIRIEQHSAMGTLWFIGWLFTIGYLHLTFWKGFLAIVLLLTGLGLGYGLTKLQFLWAVALAALSVVLVFLLVLELVCNWFWFSWFHILGF